MRDSTLAPLFFKLELECRNHLAHPFFGELFQMNNLKTSFFLFLVFFTQIAMADPIKNIFIKGKYPLGRQHAVMDVINAELQYKDTGINVFSIESQKEGVVLKKSVKFVVRADCRGDCMTLEILDKSLTPKFVIDLAKAPCLAAVYLQPHTTNNQPNGAMQPFGITKSLLPCTELSINKIDESSIQINLK